ncbi:MAG: biotin-dependent carboxyltransferase family protein [Chloroflexota bacterium]
MTGPGGVPVLLVVDPGPMATVQDAGRWGLGALGVPGGGAADPGSLEIANTLLGNEPGAAALEITLGGTAFRALARITVALAGADLGATAGPGSGSGGSGVGPGSGAGAAPGAGSAGVRITPGTTIDLREGDVLRFAGRVRGARAYLALPGGIAVPEVLGSRSTDVRAGFGGLDGRALREGDEVRAAGETGVRAAGETGVRAAGATGVRATGAPLIRPPARWSGPETAAGPLVRVIAGPHAHLAGPSALELLAATAWTVGSASDRMGLRLAGDPLPSPPGELPTLGVLPGVVQLPPDGRPIILLADCQPTGGYPVIAVVARVDRASLGQLAPGDRLQFEVVDAAMALELHAARARDLDAARAHLLDAARWDALWHGAGG